MKIISISIILKAQLKHICQNCACVCLGTFSRKLFKKQILAIFLNCRVYFSVHLSNEIYLRQKRLHTLWLI